MLFRSLGLKDVAEAKALIDAIMNGENAEVSTSAGAYTYEDLLGLSFKLVNVADTYEYDELYGVWKAKADDAAFMEGVIERGDTVRIVGLVKPDPDAKATMLTMGVYYLPSLITHVVEGAAASPIVQQQLADPEVDVITGKRFDEPADDDALDLSQIFSVDESAFQSAFSLDPNAIRFNFSGITNAISPQRIQQILQDNLSEEAIADLANAEIGRAHV